MNRLVLFVYGVTAAILMCAGTALGDVKELCVGVWKGGASGLSKETYLVVRTDGTGAAFGVSERGEQKKAYEFEFEPDGDVLKLKNRWAMRKGKRRDYNDRNEGRLWVEVKSGKLMMSDGTHMKSFERARDIEDPFRRNAGKSLKDAVVGVWRGGSEFNACSMVLAKNGDALFVFAAGGAFGKWFLTPEGDVKLLLDDSGDTQSMVAHYDPAEDMMSLGKTREIFRNVKVSPEEAMRPFKEKIAEIARQKARQRELYLADKNCVTTTNEFASVADIVTSLLADRSDGFCERLITIETGVESLSDSFHVDTRGSGFVRAFFQTSYSERGPQPADADVLVSEWRNSRPRGIVDPKRTFRNGIDKIKDSVQAYKGAGIACGEGWQVRSRGMWHSWTENAMMDWNTAKADNEAFIKLLEPRFEGRFPCKGTVLTIRTKK